MSPFCEPRRLRRSAVLLAGLAMAAFCRSSDARAAVYSVKMNGTWTTASIWTPSGGPPGVNDTAYIGRTGLPAAAIDATVTLTQNQATQNVYLGYGAGASGTLNLGNFNLAAAELALGSNGGMGAITRGSGSLNVFRLQTSASNLAMTASDRAIDLILGNGSSVTTAATANVSDSAWVQSGSTLTLGADLSIGGLANGYNIEVSGVNSTLNAQGHKITTNDLSIGWEFVNSFRVPGSNVVNFLNRGDLDVARSLFVANQSFDLTAADRVNGFALANASTYLAPGVGIQRLELDDGSTATTTDVGNIAFGAFVDGGSTLTLGADLNVGNVVGNEFVSVGGNDSILDAQGHKITAWGLTVGYGDTNARLVNRGDLDVVQLYLANDSLDLTAADRVTNFTLLHGSTHLDPVSGLERLYLGGATATTSAVENVTRSVDVTDGSTLSLGADLAVSEATVSGANSQIDADGHNITATNSLVLASENGIEQLVNRGNLAVTNLRVVGQCLDLGSDDRVTDFTLINGESSLTSVTGIQSLSLHHAMVKTGAVGNVTGSVSLSDESTLTLGADLSVSGDVDVRSLSSIDSQGHGITADTLSLVGGEVELRNNGKLVARNLVLVDQSLNLSPDDGVTNLFLSSFANELGGSTVSTAAVGNVTGSVSMASFSTLTLGADLAVSGDIDVGLMNSTLDAQGHDISANRLTVQYSSVEPGSPDVRVLNDGAVTLCDYLTVLGGVDIDLHDGNDSAAGLMLAGGSNLTIASAATGFTLTGMSPDYLLVYDSTLTLELDGSHAGWIFRWANPENRDHIADLNTLIDDGSIAFRITNGGEYRLLSENGYTYIVQPVPEPSTILLTAVAIIIGLYGRRYRSQLLRAGRPTPSTRQAIWLTCPP